MLVCICSSLSHPFANANRAAIANRFVLPLLPSGLRLPPQLPRASRSAFNFTASTRSSFLKEIE
jgi:hypothetical protein